MENSTVNFQESPFHRFRGWQILALLFVFIVYTLWYVGPGCFGQMTRIPGHISLQELGFYSGTTAVDILGRLDGEGRKIKYLALILDIPYMIMQALVFEAFIAFGFRHIGPKNSKWQLLFILPLAFLLVDFAEDSFIAITLATGSDVTGAIAGYMTALKFIIFIPTIPISLIMVIWGLIAWRRAAK